MAIVLHLLKGDQSWRVEGAHETKLEQALGAKAKLAISEFKRSTGDPKWVLVAYDKHGAIAAVDEGSLAELKRRLGDFPEIEKALENPA